MGVKSTVTNLVTNPSQLFQRGLAHLSLASKHKVNYIYK